MNDLQWQRDTGEAELAGSASVGTPSAGSELADPDARHPPGPRTYEHGSMLADAAGWTPIHLHYNSGRHVSQNGRDLAALLDQALARWPVPVQELAILGHSMGGLVARSACHHAATQQQAWLGALKHLVFLGTPHHGAPLERSGHGLDKLLGVSPYVAPFARLGKARSAGITDLRFGNVQDADWQGRHRHDQAHDDRQPTPLPEGVAVWAVAATKGASVHARRDAVVGDGLVPVASALGHHRRAALDLKLPDDHCLLLTQCNHWGLLDRAEVAQALRRWLA